MDARGIRGVGSRVEGDMVTVLMPVRDTPGPMLDQAIESILSQTCARFEFLIVDDGSRSLETVEAIAQARRRDSRIRVEATEGIGITRALNLGLSLANGKWIARQDADDWSEPDRIAKQVEFFEANPTAVLCGTAAWTHRSDGRKLWKAAMPGSHAEILRALEAGNPFFHGSAMFLKRAALEVGGYREAFACSQDYDFFWRLAEHGQAANLGEALYHYRYGHGSVSALRAGEQARAQIAARRLARARRDGDAEDVAGAFEGAHADWGTELKQADHVLLAGGYLAALRAYWQVVRRHPWRPAAWGKLARWGVFVAAPAAREWCFR